MSLPVQHLSDEAIAAYADGVLAPGARDRAARHLASCTECSHDVRRQYEARDALRAAAAPAAPSALLERLRQLPMTAPLSGPPALRTVVIGDGGAPMFAAYGTVVPEPVVREPRIPGQAPSPDAPMAADPAPERNPMSLDRGRARLRIGGRSLALAGATTMLAVGLVGGGISSASAARGTFGPAPAENARPGVQTGAQTGVQTGTQSGGVAPAAVSSSTARGPQLRIDSASRLGR